MTSEEKKLEEQFKTYEELSEKDKNVDVAGLMMNAVENAHENKVSSKMKKWAYIVSVGLPPFGLLFAAKWYFSSEDDARHVANVCVILTIVSIAISWLMIAMLFSGSGITSEQIQDVNINELRELLE